MTEVTVGTALTILTLKKNSRRYSAHKICRKSDHNAQNVKNVCATLVANPSVQRAQLVIHAVPKILTLPHK